MFSYQFVLGLPAITISFTNPITNQPQRCCFAKQYSAKKVVSSQNTLPDGTNQLSQVWIYWDISKKSSFRIDFHRPCMIMPMIETEDWLECEIFQNYVHSIWNMDHRLCMTIMMK